MKKLVIIGMMVLTNSVFGAIGIQYAWQICADICDWRKDSLDLNFCESIIMKGKGCCSYKECISRNWKFYPYVAWKYIYKFAYIILLLWFIILLFYARRRLKITIQERNIQNK